MAASRPRSQANGRGGCRGPGRAARPGPAWPPRGPRRDQGGGGAGSALQLVALGQRPVSMARATQPLLGAVVQWSRFDPAGAVSASAECRRPGRGSPRRASTLRPGAGAGWGQSRARATALRVGGTAMPLLTARAAATRRAAPATPVEDCASGRGVDQLRLARTPAVGMARVSRRRPGSRTSEAARCWGCPGPGVRRVGG